MMEFFFAVFLIPQRYVLGLMGFLAVVNAYTMRISLSIAITEMVPPVESSTHFDPDACPSHPKNSSDIIEVSQKIVYCNSGQMDNDHLPKIHLKTI